MKSLPVPRRRLPAAPASATDAALDRRLLGEFLACHATPGDEEEVVQLLLRAWRSQGLAVRRYGALAAVAAPPPDRRRRPVLLVTAHMDSPGFAVDRVRLHARRGADSARCAAGLTRLGAASFAGFSADGVLKTREGRFAVTVRRTGSRDNGDFRCTWPAGAFGQDGHPPGLSHGDRVCFASRPRFAAHRVCAPFLDNRLGCWLLAELPRLARGWRSRFRFVYGATACEEMGGLGAAVLAREVRADAVIVLDATYHAPAQGVRLGAGPVLTLSDASVLLSPALRDRLAALFAGAGVPLQTEVYNYSGTDAKAFPLQGRFAPVLALLLATTGNHTPCEAADLRDADSLTRGIRALAETWAV